MKSFRAIVAARPFILFSGTLALVALVLGFTLGRDHDGPKYQRTAREMSRFGTHLGFLSFYDNKVPGPTLADVWTRAMNDPIFVESSRQFDLIRSGKDAWGRPFIFIRSGDCRRGVLRSMGANGRDDGGKVDDINYEVTIP